MAASSLEAVSRSFTLVRIVSFNSDSASSSPIQSWKAATTDCVLVSLCHHLDFVKSNIRPNYGILMWKTIKVYKSPRNDAEPLVLESRTRISGCHGLKRLVTPLRCSVLSQDVLNFSFQKFSAPC